MKKSIHFLVMGLIVVSFIGCKRKKKTDEEVVEGAAPVVQESAAPAAPALAPGKCADGSDIKVLTGVCPGNWNVVQRNGKNACDYNFGPQISCPEGYAPTSYPSVCYGAVAGAATAAKINTAEDCEKALGKNPPADPHYSLSCCPAAKK